MTARLVLFLHVLAAIYWVGESLFEVIVLGPVTRSFAGSPWIGALQERLRPRLIWSTRTALAVLVASGIALVWAMRLPVTHVGFWATGFGRLLLFKLLAATALLGLVAIHSLVQIPALRHLRLLAAATAGPERDRARAAYDLGRRRAAWLGRSIVVLALGVVFLGIWLTTTGGAG